MTSEVVMKKPIQINVQWPLTMWFQKKCLWFDCTEQVNFIVRACNSIREVTETGIFSTSYFQLTSYQRFIDPQNENRGHLVCKISICFSFVIPTTTC